MIELLNSITGKTYMSIEKVTRQPSEIRTRNTQASQGTTFADALNQAAAKSYTKTDMDPIFEKAARTFGISLELLKAVAKAESNFDAGCVSTSGAMGVMQLMPETAKELGVSNPFDPEENIMGGAEYLSQKLKEYNQNVELALAAYNAGSGNVNKYGGIPPFTETRNYVKKILGFLENGF